MATRTDVAHIHMPLFDTDENIDVTKNTLLNSIISNREVSEGIYIANLKSIKYKLNRVALAVRKLNINNTYEQDSSFNKLSAKQIGLGQLIDTIPPIPIKRDKVNFNIGGTPALDKHKKNVTHVCGILGINPEQVIEEVDKNPDIDAIDDVFFTNQMNFLGVDPLQLKYTWDFFERIVELGVPSTEQEALNRMEGTILNFEFYSPMGDEGTPEYLLNKYSIINGYTEVGVGQELLKIDEGEFIKSLGFSYIETGQAVVDNPVIGYKGLYGSDYDLRSFPFSLTHTVGNTTLTIDENTLSIRKRHPYIESQYFYINVYGLNVADKIILRNSNDYKVSFASVPYPLEIDTVESIEFNSNKNQLLFPISLEIMDKLTIRDAERLLYKSQYLSINAIVVTKLKWYETSAFGSFLKILGIVITVLSLGAGSPVGISLTSLAYAITSAIVINLVIDYSIEWAVENLNEKDATAFIILITIASAITGKAVDLSKALAATIETLLETTIAILKNLVKLDQFELQQINQEYSEFQESMDERLEDVRIQTAFLQSNSADIGDSLLNPRKYVASTITSNETPQEFYRRTIKTGNIGAKIYDINKNYVKNSLKLPELSLEGNFI